MKKQDYHHGNLKDELLAVAFEIIASEDVESLTLKALSEKTGTSRTAIYRHFKNKEALIETILRQGFDTFDSTVSPILEESNTELIDRFYRAGKTLIAFAMQNPNLYRLLFGKRYAHIREEAMKISDEDCSGFASLKHAIEEGQKMGVLQQKDSYQQAIIIWASLHGLASLIIDGFEDVETLHETLYTQMFEMILAGTLSKKAKLASAIPILKNKIKPTQG